MDAPVFTAQFQDELAALIRWRRDVRRFRRDPLPDGLIEHFLDLASHSPSVGLSQPWRFVIVRQPAARASMRENFMATNADALRGYHGEKAEKYASLKLAGLDDSPVQLAAFVDTVTPYGSGLGRRTMPETLAYSVVGAIQTLWLVTRAEGVGVGWVSILDPARVLIDLAVPAEWGLIAYLCIGYPDHADDTPELERAQWEHRQTVEQFISYR